MMPPKEDWSCVLNVSLNTSKGTIDSGVPYSGRGLELIAYSDASLGRKNDQGLIYTQNRCGCGTSWRYKCLEISQTENCGNPSSMESEYLSFQLSVCEFDLNSYSSSYCCCENLSETGFRFSLSSFCAWWCLLYYLGRPYVDTVEKTGAQIRI
jgi:hypothetical protein